MAISYVQPVAAITASTSATSFVGTFFQGVTGSTTAGNRIVLTIACGSGVTVTGVTDTQGNTYSIDVQTGGANQNVGIFSAFLTHAVTNADTYTVSLSATNKPEVAGAEYSGIAATGFVESTGSTTSGGAGATTTSNRGLTPAAATSQLFSGVSTASTSAVGITDTSTTPNSPNYTQRVWSGSNALLDDLNNASNTLIQGIFNWIGTGKWAWAGVVYVSSPTVTGSASLSATATLTATGVVAAGSASFSATASLTATGHLSGTVHGAASLSATASLTATGTPYGVTDIFELGTLGAELAAMMAASVNVWVPTHAVLRIHTPTATLRNPAPAAALNPYVTSVVLGGSE